MSLVAAASGALGALPSSCTGMAINKRSGVAAQGAPESAFFSIVRLESKRPPEKESGT